jgi:transcriptional regulator with XRE-family HTH domain
MTKLGEPRIGRRIKAARIMRSMTQGDLSRRAEISQGYLSQVELGERTPSDEVVELIQHALGVDFSADEL